MENQTFTPDVQLHIRKQTQVELSAQIAKLFNQCVEDGLIEPEIEDQEEISFI
ncbi:hypothetical protein AGMMS50249_0360 [candidate division SR1 bacterium]|nr:hypothetical protein AGMMS50249_0360 [candidate division SR1 bacterium]